MVESGKRSVCYYNTPAGEMLIGIFGEKVEHNLKKNGGSVFPRKYTIDQNLNFVNRSTVKISRLERLKNNVDFSRKSKGTDKQLRHLHSRRAQWRQLPLERAELTEFSEPSQPDQATATGAALPQMVRAKLLRARRAQLRKSSAAI